MPIGIHFSPDAIRLTYAPAGEAPGRLTFPVDALRAADGRVLVDALVMLLGRARLLTVPIEQRLGAVLVTSRKRQEKVTVALAGQVKDALRILLEVFDAANDRAGGAVFWDSMTCSAIYAFPLGSLGIDSAIYYLTR